MITTLTLSPAFDVHVNIGEFKLDCENLAESVSRDIGGKGINISSALHENGIENEAIVLLGEENSAEFIAGLESVGLNYKLLTTNGRIRENITIHPSKGKETRLSFKGFACSEDVLGEVLKMLKGSKIVTFTGSLPQGISATAAEKFLLAIKDIGAKLVIDSKSISLDMLLNIKPWLIKPNEEEIKEYFGVVSEEEIIDKALILNEAGIENVMVSLGGKGAILVNDGKVYRAYVPEIEVVSTIGAGDSSIAGFISCTGDVKEKLKRAVSFGSAACMREGTNPPKAEDIKKIYEKVKIV